MTILQKLTIQNLSKNKRRTVVTIIGVMLSSALILTVVGMVTSFQKMMLNVAISETGNYQEVYQEVPIEALEYITDNQHVKDYFYSEPISEQAGSEVFATYEEYPKAPYKVTDYDRFDTLPEQPQGTYNVFVNYDTPSRYVEIREQIQQALSSALNRDINVRTNSDILRAYGVVNDVALTSLYWIATIIVAIIVATSIFVIRNSFSISATERARQFGMLSSVGATPRQIRHSVLFEGVVIGAFGIPLGILLGCVATAILVVVVNILLEGMVVSAIEFFLPFWVFPLVVILSFATIIPSCLLSAIRASRLSAIEAIRGNDDFKIKARKMRTPEYIKRLFGIGGVIANKNLRRSRKKYRTTVISIILSVATFVGLSSFLTYGKKAIALEYQRSQADIILYGGDTEFYQALIKKFQLKDYAYYQTIPGMELNLYLVNKSTFEDFARVLGVQADDYRKVAIMNNSRLESESGSYKVTKLDNAQENMPYSLELYQYECETAQVEAAKGTQCHVSEKNNTINLEIPITKLVDTHPFGLENNHMMPAIYVSEDYYQNNKISHGDFNASYTFVAKNIDDLPAIDDYMEQFTKSQKQFDYIYYTNIKEQQEQMQRMLLLMEIFLYGFIVVVTLIGVTNIFNTITTNIALRAKEFAMLKSIGMTRKEFNHMVRLESVMYASKALFIGSPIGLVLAYGFYLAIAHSIDFGFTFPLSAVIISVAAVGLLVGIIMRYSVRQVEKQNIIETIRSENV